MRRSEQLLFQVRHSRRLKNFDRLWNAIRPLYNWASNLTSQRGLERVINGTDKILLAPRWRMISEQYEPDVWRALMSEVRAGDVVADVGSYVGLYTIALAQRVGASGQVVAFEPNESNYQSLKEHVELNKVTDNVTLVRAAVGDREGYAELESNFDSSFISGRIDSSTKDQSATVKCLTLDGYFAGKKLDLLKIDVEGYEEKVLAGASLLLTDQDRSPRLIFIEVHPYAWPELGTTSDSILSLLSRFNYEVKELGGEPVQRITEYGEVVAHKIA